MSDDSFSDDEVEMELGDDDDDIEDEDEGDFQMEEEGEGDDEEEGEISDEKLKENLYYEAKQEEDVLESIESFRTIVDMEEVPGPWGFKSLKQMCKRMFAAKLFPQMIQTFKQLLDFGKKMSRNQNENAINRILLMVSGTEAKLVNEVYEIALSSLQNSGNEKLWFNTKLQQGNSLVRMKNWKDLEVVVSDLKRWCSLPSGQPDPKKNSQLLEVYVLEIQMYTEKEEYKKLKDLYTKCREFETEQGAVVSNPIVTGIIRECGGKMNMREKQWANGYADFFDAFKSYDEGGNPKRIQCLQYLIVVAMLRSSAEGVVIDPFDSPEVKPYANHPKIKAMTDLIRAYRMNNINEFENTLRVNKKQIEADEFLNHFISDLLRSVRMKVLLVLIRPYRRIRMNYLGRQLHISDDLVENLLSDLILDNKLNATIDQIQGLLILESVNRDESAKKRYEALEQWTKNLKQLHSTVINKID